MRAAREWLLPGISALLVVAVALLAQGRLPLNADAQWILSVAERVTRGEHLYRDILEINPPLVIWLQVPLVWTAHAFGTGPALIYRVAIVVCALLLTWAVYALCLRLDAARRLQGHRWIPVVVLATFLLLPGGMFGQREQLITMLLLPAVLLHAIRVEGESISPLAALGVGLASGLAIGLKPYFIAVWLLLLLHRLLAARPLRLRIEPEDIAVGGTGLLYLMAVVVLAPEYVGLARTFAATYAAYTTMTTPEILLGSAAIIWFGVAVVAWRVRKNDLSKPLGASLAIAALGAVVAAVWQGKGWTYHFLPAVSFSVLLGALALTGGGVKRRGGARRLARAAAALVLLLSWIPLAGAVVAQLRGLGQRADTQAEIEGRALRQAVGRQAGARSILVLSSDMTGSQPWIEDQRLASRNSWSCLWVPAVMYHTRWNGNPRIALRRAAEMPQAERVAYASVIRDFTVNSPDLLVVESRAKNERFTGYPGGFDHLAYYGADSRFAACLAHYRLAAAPAGFEVYRRTTPSGGAALTGSGSCA
jgi:hypothetical protein